MTIPEIVAKMRADLEAVGGFENELLSVPAGGVRNYIEALETALQLLKRYVSETPLGHQPHMIAEPALAAITSGSAALAALRSVPAEPVPADCDVRKLLIDVVPGDGDGYEVYAKSIRDVEAKLGELWSRVEDWEMGIRRLPASATPPPAPVLSDAWNTERGQRCPHCDGTGDVHSIDGQWRGRCYCPEGQANPGGRASRGAK